MAFDPTIGRWTEEDPIGFAGGDVNLYRYVGNGPAMEVDPLGLYQQQPPYTAVASGPAQTLEYAKAIIRQSDLKLDAKGIKMIAMLENTKIEYKEYNNDQRGGYDSTTNTIFINARFARAVYWTATSLTHELYHKIDEIENGRHSSQTEEVKAVHYELMTYELIRQKDQHQDTALQRLYELQLKSQKEFEDKVKSMYPKYPEYPPKVR